MTTAAQRFNRRHNRRKHRRRLEPAFATAISTRTRWRLWPRTKAITRYHRYWWRHKPRCKWADYEERIEG